MALNVQFTDQSTNSPTSWSWSFGDGGTSTAQNPSHAYSSAGTYTVALTATNATGSNTLTRTGYITVTGTGSAWLSGAGDDNASNTAGGGFGTWRGEAATYARAWADASLAAMSGLDMVTAYRTSNWNGILDVAVGGPRDGQTWASAATGGMDSMWRAQCQKLHAGWWSNCKGLHLSMAHEMSGNWYPWSVNSGNVANFKTAWRRWYGIVGEELKAKGRNVDVVMSYNFDTVSDMTVQQIDPGGAYYDVVGVDFYNMYWGGDAAAGLNTQSAWDSNLMAYKGTSPKGIGAWFQYAQDQGKPLSVPEWGTSPQALVEATLFVANMRNLFASKVPTDPYNPGAGKIAGESYFNTWNECRLWPSTSLPNTAAAYKALNWGGV